jgi:hypothetical protein
MPESGPRPHTRWGAALLALALLALLAAYLPLATNPGWFSHDELQWAERARVQRASDLPWVPWLDVATFQWRPLTFNLWLLLSWASGNSPLAMHLTWLLLGASVTALLWTNLRAIRLAPQTAACGALAFAASPFAVYVHGWVATLADLLWVGLGLAAARAILACDARRTLLPAAIALAATATALLAKEAALSLAPLALLAWWLSGRERRWLGAAVAASLVAAIYLALRLPALSQLGSDDAAYAWSLASIPARWIEIASWTFVPSLLEPGSMPELPLRRLLPRALLFAILAGCALRAGPRIGIAFVLGGLLALGPALTLSFSSAQYGYGFAAVSCAALACAWQPLRWPLRALLLLALTVSCWHGLNVQRGMRRVGELQAVFTPSLQRAAAGSGDALVLHPDRPTDIWIYKRLSVAASSAHAKIRITTDAAAATHLVRADGEVAPARDTPARP